MITRIAVASVLLAGIAGLEGGQFVQHPFAGMMSITRTETSPRSVTMHIVEVDLTEPGITFKLTPPGGSLATVRQTTLEFLNQEYAQLAINAHFFLPFPSSNPEAMLVGFGASQGTVYSRFETAAQSFAIVANAPAINIDSANHTSIVHNDPGFPDGKHILENVMVWNALAGSAQIVTNGVKTIPSYASPENVGGLLTPSGAAAQYTNAKSWYDAIEARSAIGL